MSTEENKTASSRLPPLTFGRVTRVIFGLATFGLILYVGPDTLGIWGVIGIAFLGLSFLVGGLAGNPGCELTAIPNLVLRPEQRLHCT